MLEELRCRNYAESTIHIYIQTVEHFSQHFHRSPDQLGPEHIRQYQAALFTGWKLAPNTVTQRLAALRFFYVQVLKRGWSVAETPYPKKVWHLPQVLSQEEVARLIDAAEFPVMLSYSNGCVGVRRKILKTGGVLDPPFISGNLLQGQVAILRGYPYQAGSKRPLLGLPTKPIGATRSLDLFRRADRLFNTVDLDSVHSALRPPGSANVLALSGGRRPAAASVC
jgi:hypothetical protein